MFLFQTRMVHRHSCYILTIIVSSVAVKIHIKIAHFMRFFAIKITFKRGFYYIIPEMMFNTGKNEISTKTQIKRRNDAINFNCWWLEKKRIFNFTTEIERYRENGKSWIFILLYFVFDMCRKPGNEMICKWIKKVLIIITKRLACHQVVLQLKNSLVFVKCAHIKKPSECAHPLDRSLSSWLWTDVYECLCARACVYVCDESNSLY